MELNQNILRIKEVMGLLNEQKTAEVKINGSVSYNGDDYTDWDLVHGFFSSKKLSNDLEEKVSNFLTKGDFVVKDVVISSSKDGNSISTKGTVYLASPSPNELPDKYFTTRGSIGKVAKTKEEKDDPNWYVTRHDIQVDGLVDRLKVYYKSNGVKTFGPFEIFIDGTNYAYKQSFFAVKGNGSKSQTVSDVNVD